MILPFISGQILIISSSSRFHIFSFFSYWFLLVFGDENRRFYNSNPKKTLQVNDMCKYHPVDYLSQSRMSFIICFVLMFKQEWGRAGCEAVADTYYPYSTKPPLSCWSNTHWSERVKEQSLVFCLYFSGPPSVCAVMDSQSGKDAW